MKTTATKTMELMTEDDDLKELAQGGLVESVHQTLINILETVWQNQESHEKIKDKKNIYTRPEKRSSLVVKKFNKEIWQAHLTSRDRPQKAVLKSTIAMTQLQVVSQNSNMIEN